MSVIVTVFDLTGFAFLLVFNPISNDDFEGWLDDESDRGGVEEGELKTSGVPTKEDASGEEIIC